MLLTFSLKIIMNNVGDHFCPIVPPHIATQNRKKRKRSNHFKALAQQGLYFPPLLATQVSFKRNMLTASILHILIEMILMFPASATGIPLYSLQDTFGSLKEYTNFLKGMSPCTYALN